MMDSTTPETNPFEERAEYLPRELLMRWTAETPHEKEILAKLTGPGAKLLSGPRGCGKSTLLRSAYFELVESGRALVAYVNYARSMALEPLFHERADALRLFRQWVLKKILVGVNDGLEAADIENASLRERASEAKEFINGLEVGDVRDGSVPIGPSELIALLEEVAQGAGMKRIVLLLDDAAHAFSSKQQREFFEIFRELRSHRVAAKAAVYPGVTSYSPNFHVGHEAELLEAWLDPNDDRYLATLREVLRVRLPLELTQRLEGHGELVDLLALSSFGLPRGYLHMLSEILGVETERARAPSRKLALEAVDSHTSATLGVYQSLAAKLPRYSNFIQVGEEVLDKIISALRDFNKGKPISKKAGVIAISAPLPPELERIIHFLEYAGLLRETQTVSRGVKGQFQRYQVHFGLLVSRNALSLGRSFSVNDLVASLRTLDPHAYVRRSAGNLLEEAALDRCTLDLEPCSKCQAARPNEDARFCMNCGAELTSASVYEELLKSPVSALPLTDRKKQGLVEHQLKTVQDILIDEDLRQIRAIPYVGKVWAARIRTCAEEFVTV